MKYYADPGSGSCRRVSAVIEHLNLDVDVVSIDLFKGESNSAEFLAINPNGMVPALVDDDVILWEASAIMIYLAEKKNNSLLPRSGVVRYDILRWMFWAAEHFRQPGPIYFEERLVTQFMGTTADESRIAEANRLMERYAPVLDTHLANRKYVVGDQVTLADFDLAAPLSQMSRTGVPYNSYPNILRWYKHLNDTVPAWRNSGERLEQRMNSAIAAAEIKIPEFTH